jgi:hypothetical protein
MVENYKDYGNLKNVNNVANCQKYGNMDNIKNKKI